MASPARGCLAVLAAAQPEKPDQSAASYFPEAAWQRKTPAQAGFNPQRLKEAIDYAIAGESRAPRDLALSHYQSFGREPFGYAIGPIRERGDPSGLIIRHGYIVAEWGEPSRALHHRHEAAADPHAGDAAVALFGAGFEQARTLSRSNSGSCSARAGSQLRDPNTPAGNKPGPANCSDSGCRKGRNRA
jgi:hypothetical protein